MGYLSHLGGEPPTSKFRAMLMTQLYTFVIDRPFCLLSRFLMILLLFLVCRRIERSLSSLRLFRGSLMPLNTCGLNLQSLTGSCRYLGVLLSQHGSIPATWSNCIRSIWSRLVLARAKTHTVEQRAKIASAIAVPNVIYLARQCWTSYAMVSQLQSLNMNFVWGVRDGKRSRTWVPSKMASLPIQQDGLSVPFIRM